MSTIILLLAVGFVGWLTLRPRFGSSRQAPTTAAATQVSSFATALEAFKIDEGFYPPTAVGLRALLPGTNHTVNWKGPYLKEVPEDPWGNAYCYEYPGRHNTNSFELMSLGPDEKAGSADDITSWRKGN